MDPVCLDCGTGLVRKGRGPFPKRCKSCAAIRQRLQQNAWKARNPEASRASHARKRDYDREYSKQWRSLNRDQKRETCRAWRDANPERVSAMRRAWREANPERYREIKRRRRARAQGIDTAPIVDRDLDRLLHHQRHACAYCALPLVGEMHLDHVVPIARGGRHGIGNVVWACPRCNRTKNARLLADFRREPFVVM